MENDLISRSALIAAYDAAHKGPPGGARKLIVDAPAVDATLVIHARWQKVNPFVDTEECSNCRYNILSDEFETPYCPWCNAKMAGDNL